jgi:predicted DNA repair protein MutK
MTGQEPNRMPTGLVALLDDVAAIARLAAASVDDIAAASMKASSKAIGVVVDDAAVTPKYVSGLTPARELPIIWRIAKGSLRNKLLLLLPAALLLSAFLPWAITPILMIGGLYLAYEGAEKIIEAVSGHGHAAADEAMASESAEELENSKVGGAIRTDLILSGEIMAIALSEVSDKSITTQAAALIAVSILITAGVYGVVGLIVKMDDIGLHLASRRGGFLPALGRGLVKSMPIILSLLAKIGTVAMLWVGGGILIHGLEEFHLTPIPHIAETVGHAIASLMPFAPGFGAWLGFAVASAILGLVIGGVIALIVPPVKRVFAKG